MSISLKPGATAEYPAWAKDRLEEVPGWLTSLLLHVAILLVFWQIVLPLSQKNRPVETVILGYGADDESGFFAGMAAVDGGPSLEDAEGMESPASEPEQFVFDADSAAIGTPEAAKESESSAQPDEGTAVAILPTLPGIAPRDSKKAGSNDGENSGKLPRATQRKAGPASGAAKEQGRDLSGMLTGRGPEAREKLVKSGGGNKASERAVEAGLEWLARQQQPDGSWDFQQVPGDAGDLECPMGATGLALLAYLGAGHTHRDGTYRSHVNEGLRYLVDHMQISESGGWLGGTGLATMYVQAIGAIALCEACSMTKDPELRRPAQLAIDFICKAQDPSGGGWRYRIPQAGDTSVFGWQLMALQSAKIAELSVPPRVSTRAAKFLKSVEFDGGASFGYQDSRNVRPSMTAVGLLCRMYLGREQSHRGMIRGMHKLAEWGPSPSDMYYNYYATQAMHHWGGPKWERWNSVMRDALVGSQDQLGELAGSWHTDGSHSAHHGGRLYTTCLSILTLEVYYRYLSLYRRPSAVEVDPNADESTASSDMPGK